VILKRGDSGPDVEHLQVKLKAAGYDCGDVDGGFGQKTYDAVLAFQADRPDLEDDGVAGAMTLGALDAAIARNAGGVPALGQSAIDVVACEASTWSAFQQLVTAVTQHPVRYGPGRGLWHDGKFIVTAGPGALGVTSWKNALGRPFASFHCTSWANFFLGWLLRRNERYTHGGNIPSVFDLLTSSSRRAPDSGGGAYRGYGDACSPIAPDGSAVARSGVAKVVDARELLARRASLPTFIVCAQSTKRPGGWLWWHHVVLFVVDHRDRDRLYRIAADGSKGANGYSGDPMRWVEITEGNVARYDALRSIARTASTRRTARTATRRGRSPRSTSSSSDGQARVALPHRDGVRAPPGVHMRWVTGAAEAHERACPDATGSAPLLTGPTAALSTATRNFRSGFETLRVSDLDTRAASGPCARLISIR
jgi:hypothetical protein